MHRMNTLRLTLLGATIALLAACSGGASTTVNGNPTTQGGGDDYAGPAPANAEVQSFRINFWQNVKAANRCGGCHNATGQEPRGEGAAEDHQPKRPDMAHEDMAP